MNTNNIKSKASIYYSYTLDGQDYQNSAFSNTLINQVKKTKLVAKKIANAKYFKPNDIITYTIVISNFSNYSASNIEITDLLGIESYIPNSFTYTFLQDLNEEVTFNINNSSLNFLIKKMPELSTCLITYKTKVNEELSLSDNINNYSSFRSNETDYTSLAPVSLEQKYAKIICNKSILDDNLYLNTDITYKIIAKNIGNYEANNVILYDELPETFALANKNPILVNGKVTSDFIFDSNPCILKVALNTIEPDEEVEILVKGSITK